MKSLYYFPIIFLFAIFHSISLGAIENQGVIGGVILGYENYSDELNYQKLDGSKSFKISNTYSRISIKAYLGFLCY